MRMRLLVVAATCVGVIAGACTGSDATSPVPDSTFVRTMVELQRVSDDTLLDSLMRDSARHVILRRHGLSTDRLVQAARAMASNPDHAVQIWKAIDSSRYSTPSNAPRRASPMVTHPNTSHP